MQVKITITEKNREKIAAILEQVQGPRSSVRCLSASDIFAAAVAAEKHLAKIFSFKKDYPGAKYHGGEYGKFPNAYKYTPMGTTFDLTRNKTGWILTGARRENCSGENYFTFSQEQENIIAAAAVSNARRG